MRIYKGALLHLVLTLSFLISALPVQAATPTPLSGLTWSHTPITWAFATPASATLATVTNSITNASQQAVIKAALAEWSAASGVQLVQITDPTQANIQIGYGNVGLSQTTWYYSPSNNTFISTLIRLQDPAITPLVLDASGNLSYQGGVVWLQQVAAQAVGTSLGLGGSSDPTSIMNSTVGTTNRVPNAQDIAAVQSLYGTVTTPVPTVSLSASPTSITSGQSSTLSWSSTNATACTGTGFTASGTSGSVAVSPTANTTYSISCTGTGGSATQSTSVVVSAPVVIPTPLLGLTWTHSPLTWAFSTPASSWLGTTTNSITDAAQQAVIKAAFQEWTAISGVKLVQITDPTIADIQIGYANTAAIGLIGQALWYYNPSNSTFISGLVRLLDPAIQPLAPDASGNLTYQGDVTWLQQVAAHEIGVDLGLAEGTSPTSITSHYMSAANRVPDAQDIIAIQKLYGPPTTTPAPTVTLSAAPTSITAGQSSTLSWTSTNATSCTGTGFTASGVSGSAMVSPTANTTYAISCTGAGGSAMQSATVSVTAATPAPTVSLSASPTSITSGQSSTLTWSSMNATSCTGTGFTASGVSGSVAISPTANTTYSISCTGAGGSATQSAAVMVSAPATSTGPVALWTFDTANVSGSSVYDTSGNSHTGTSVGSPTLVTGKFGQALSLNGSSQYVDVPMAISGDAFTVSAWFNPSSLTGNARIVANSHTDADNKGFQLQFDGGGQNGYFDIGNGSSQGYAAWSTNLSTNQWYHYVGVYDGTKVYAYINGVLVGSQAYTGSIAASGYDINIGRNPVYAADYFNGAVDDVRIYNRALSATEVTTLYNQGGAVTPPPPPPPPPPPVPTVSLTATPTSITSGQSSTLSWTSTNATSCTGTGFTASGTSGSVSVTPTQTTTYGVSCTSAGGTATGQTTVTVSAVTPPPPPPPPPPGLAIGQRVKTTTAVNVRRSASNSSRSLGTQPTGALGTITSGPQSGSGYTWWNVNFDKGADGWVVATYLTNQLAVASPQATLSTTEASPSTITHTLSVGWSGPEVAALQSALAKFGAFQGEVTGYFGQATKAAVKSFQAANNLAAVGVVGPKTRSLLSQILR